MQFLSIPFFMIIFLFVVISISTFFTKFMMCSSDYFKNKWNNRMTAIPLEHFKFQIWNAFCELKQNCFSTTKKVQFCWVAAHKMNLVYLLNSCDSFSLWNIRYAKCKQKLYHVISIHAKFFPAMHINEIGAHCSMYHDEQSYILICIFV